MCIELCVCVSVCWKLTKPRKFRDYLSLQDKHRSYKERDIERTCFSQNTKQINIERMKIRRKQKDRRATNCEHVILLLSITHSSWVTMRRRGEGDETGVDPAPNFSLRNGFRCLILTDRAKTASVLKSLLGLTLIQFVCQSNIK